MKLLAEHYKLVLDQTYQKLNKLIDIRMTDEIAKYNADIIAADDLVIKKVKQKITLIKQAQKDSSIIKALQTELEACRAKDLDALMLDKSKLNVAAAWLAMKIDRK